MYKNLIWLFIWLLFLCSSQSIKAQDDTIDLELKQYRSIKVCGEEKDRKFQISVGAGEIKDEDKFYAVEFYLTYNPKKIKFNNVLKSNTLAQFFEFTGLNPLDSGLVKISAATLTMANAYGNMPLIAMDVEYIGECDDTTIIYLKDLEMDISKSFFDRLNYKNKSLIVDADVKVYPSSFVEARFMADTISDYNEDSTAVVTVNVNTNGLQKTDSLDFLLKMEKGDNFLIDNIAIMSENIIRDTVLEYEQGDSSFYLLKTHLTGDLPDESAFEVRIKRTKKIDDTLKIMLSIAVMNECTCALNFIGDKIFLISKIGANELELIKYGNIKICGEEKDRRFQILVSAGEIKDEYKFYGGQYYFRYNPEKIKFISVMKTNTLSAFFENDGLNPQEPGLVTVTAATLGTTNASGNKPLIAMEVEYIGECVDTTTIYLDDMNINISGSFLDSLNYKGKALLLKAEVMEYPTSFVEAKFTKDSLSEYDDDSTAVLTVNVNTNGLQKTDSLDFLLKIEKNDNFKIAGINITNEKIIVDSLIEYEEGDTSYSLLKTHLSGDLPDERGFEVRIKRNNEIDDTNKLVLNIAGINECTCAINLKGDKIFLISKKDTDTAVVNKIENNENKIDAFYDFISNDFIIRTFESAIDMVKIYDINGDMVYNNEFGMKSEYRVKTDNFCNGIYFSRIKLINGFEKNIVLIKN